MQSTKLGYLVVHWALQRFYEGLYGFFSRFGAGIGMWTMGKVLVMGEVWALKCVSNFGEMLLEGSGLTISYGLTFLRHFYQLIAVYYLLNFMFLKFHFKGFCGFNEQTLVFWH
ncbi:hypothetical protein [Bartonella massiliensis]|uniref:hypothetical protein n=1 Tax=Bartonella massiliensis TaxID=929795 RepID=UPI00115880CF|nr:hypothetical protein [Bartonella massiliensis]